MYVRITETIDVSQISEVKVPQNSFAGILYFAFADRAVDEVAQG